MKISGYRDGIIIIEKRDGSVLKISTKKRYEKIYFSMIEEIVKLIYKETKKEKIVNLRLSLDNIRDICNLYDEHDMLLEDDPRKDLRYYNNLIRGALSRRCKDMKTSIHGDYIYIFDKMITYIRAFPQYILDELDYLDEIVNNEMNKAERIAVQTEINSILSRYSRRSGQLNLYSRNSLCSKVQLALLKNRI